MSISCSVTRSDGLEAERDGFVALVVGLDGVRDEPDRRAQLVVLEVVEVAVHEVALDVPAAVEVDDRRDEAVTDRTALHDAERAHGAGGGEILRGEGALRVTAPTLDGCLVVQRAA